MKSFIGISIFLTFVGCSYFINKMDSGSVQVNSLTNPKVSFVFSGNISGETHPCGCRHFPLGGLDHVAGAMAKIKKDHPIVYLDAGDAFFPSNNIPDAVSRSLKFTASNISKAFNMLELAYQVPGDQDFSGHKDFLKELQTISKHHYLVANASSLFDLPTKKWARYDNGPSRIYLTGIVNPDTLLFDRGRFFTPPVEALKKVFEEMKSDGFDTSNPLHRLVLLSHSGVDYDRQLAQAFPIIDWIIGSHSQSFTKIPFEEGKTKLVQVLSRNHYLGEIIFQLDQDKSKDTYQLIEVRQELAQELTPNPFTEFISKHKSDLEKVQLEEQKSFSVQSDYQDRKYPTANSCIECHKKQGEFWSSTPHSLAYLTLVRVKQKHNMACIKCHSLGAGDAKGFGATDEIVELKLKHAHDGDEHFHEKADLDDEKLKNAQQKQLANYWKEVFSKTPVDKSIRDLKASEIKKGKKNWDKLDDKYSVTANYANVQCLNCHSKHPDHPFNSKSESIDTPENQYQQIKDKCLDCHVPDQSPHWYHLQENNLPGALNEEKFKAFYKNKSCPKYEQ